MPVLDFMNTNELTDEEFQSLFEEWKELFTRFRKDGSLPEEERKRLRELSARLQERVPQK